MAQINEHIVDLALDAPDEFSFATRRRQVMQPTNRARVSVAGEICLNEGRLNAGSPELARAKQALEAAPLVFMAAR